MATEKLNATSPSAVEPDEAPFVGSRPSWLAGVPRWVVLAAISAITFAISAMSVLQNRPDFGAALPLLALALIGALALLGMRRFPIAVVLITTVLRLIEPMSSLAQLPALYALGAYGKKNWQIWGVAVLCVLEEPLAWLVKGFHGNFEALLSNLVVWSLFLFFPVVVGRYMAGRRTRLVHWVERAERAERERSLIAERTRSEERARIAREMHDSVAHQVSLVVVHAGALEMVAKADPEKAASAAATIQQVGRGALDELRQMIGVLRANPGDETPEPPQPKLKDLESLVSASRDAGLDVELVLTGDRRDLADQVERAAYRVVQEALTNVHKHAGGARATVALDYRPKQLALSVRNGRPAAGFQRSLPSGGQGLIGLAERVQLAGGEISSGRLPDGGFEVSATLPAQPRELS
ncbi:Signal transduction histidine kinase [Saccharopolyspora kobensis]|uniref:histidine kinase n=1 Tax=Saccharopolyspora kobensis TaxID=146035 RepID=A0A1H6EJ70_9PSEU|nr:histidine kinase [Saccharopolyspora kobensis]SEG97928.1 Signal transduction histidine kinase [Saccharopolyspora kobensis]SFF23544.1 Signal transduction histidine kinase [Saccharopolyspora kobensis]